MKLLTILCTSLLLLLSLAPQDSPELKEASELGDSVVKLFNDGKYDDALKLAKRALEIRERLLPANDPRVGTSLNNLAEVYIAKRDYGKARDTYLRLLQHQAERFGADNVTLARTLDRLGALHFHEGDNAKAEEAFKRALELNEKKYGADHVEVAHSLYALAEFYRARRDFAHGQPAYSRALKTYAKNLGVSSPEFERTSEGYSCLGYDTTKFDVFADINSIWALIATPNGPATAPAGTILNGKALWLPKPAYPDAARLKRISGTVVVKIKIDETGTVVSAKDMCGGPPYLSESSVQAAYGARFSPTKLSGKPVPVYGIIQFRFVAQ
jgi:TonB family protein